MSPLEFSRLLRQVRAGLGLREFARAVGCSHSYLKKLESGDVLPTRRFIGRLRKCDLFATVELPEVAAAPRTQKKRRRGLPRIAVEIRKAFHVARPERHVEPLAHAFDLARYTPEGRELVRRLDAQRRSGAFFRAVKWQARFLNGPEQRVLLQLLTPQASIHELHPRVVGIPLPVVETPEHWWLATVTPVEDQRLVCFAQLRVEVRPGWTRRMDFFVALTGTGMANVEVDGPTHRGRSDRDRVREEEIGLPTVRVRAEEPGSPDFLPRLVARIREACAGR